MMSDIKKEVDKYFNDKYWGAMFEAGDFEALLSDVFKYIDKATLAERSRSDMKIAGVMKEATLAQKKKDADIARQSFPSFGEDIAKAIEIDGVKNDDKKTSCTCHPSHYTLSLDCPRHKDLFKD